MSKLKNVIKNLLLAFVLISIGYAIGKHSTMRLVGKSDTLTGNVKSGQYLRVYYTHANVRCETCNKIEKKTRELLESKFKNELDSGRIEWQLVNFQENDAFAKEFDVTASGVIAVLMNGDKVVDYERLDGVWPLLSDLPAFNAYLEKSFRKLLSASVGGVK
ncbi:MAG: nitrophenyl compound nitroreductase subunit ArsF family protein [Lentisphaerota bacterium]